MCIFILILFILLLLFFSYYSNNKNLFTPSLICCLSFLIGTSLLANNAINQGIDIHPQTIFVIILGLSGIIVGEKIASRGTYKKTTLQKESFENLSFIYINKMLSYLLLLVNVAIVYMFYKEVVRIGTSAATSSLGSFSDIMASYRTSMMFGDILEYNVNPIVSQFVKIVIISTYIYLFTFIYNAVKGLPWKKNIINLLVSLPYFAYVFFTGGRLGFITILAAILWYVFITMYFKKDSYNFKMFQSKFKKYVVISLCCILTLFYSLRLAMGRANTKDDEFLDYITIYIGTPTLLLDKYLEEPKNENFSLSKSETFIGLGIFFAKMEGKKKNAGLEFRYESDGTNLGNVYTPFRRYYNDFGYIGVFVLPLIMGFVLKRILSKCYYPKSFNKKTIFCIMIFAYLFTALPTYAAEDIFYIRLKLGFIEELILLYIFYKYLIRFKYNHALK